MSLLNNNPSSFTLCDWIGVNWKISLGNPLEDYSFLGLWFSRVTLNCRRWKWRVRQGFRNVRYKLGSLEWLQHSWVSIWMCLQDQDRETWRKASAWREGVGLLLQQPEAGKGRARKTSSAETLINSRDRDSFHPLWSSRKINPPSYLSFSVRWHHVLLQPLLLQERPE